MSPLEQQLRYYARRRNARWWAGARPDGRDRVIPRLVAAAVGYPTAPADPFESGGMMGLTRAEAAHVLAVAGTCSLVYGDATPRSNAVRDAVQALAVMGDDAVFLSTGRWQSEAGSGGVPFTTATFDCGLIGYDATSAFIFWVEEED